MPGLTIGGALKTGDDPVVRCASCDTDITDLFAKSTFSDGRTGLDGGGLVTTVDYFGDGRDHPPSDFPVPDPDIGYGVRLMRRGELLHACGTWASTP